MLTVGGQQENTETNLVKTSYSIACSAKGRAQAFFRYSSFRASAHPLDHCKPAFDWAAAYAEQILRCCPKCLRDSIIGHGRRQKQAHDESHDWIQIRRGICLPCGLTFTFLPLFSRPYTHYSLIARSEALRRYFVEHDSWERAAPSIKDPDRIPDPSILRRWFRSLDSSLPPFSFLWPAMQAVSQWLAGGEQLECGSLRLSWPTLFPFLQVFWPLRL